MLAEYTPRHLRILVVEDNFDIAENISDYLEAEGNILDFSEHPPPAVAQAIPIVAEMVLKIL